MNYICISFVLPNMSHYHNVFFEQDRSAGFLVVEQPIIFHEGCISYTEGAVVGVSGFTFYTELHDTTQALNNKLEIFLILEHVKLPQQYFLGQQNEETLRSLTKDDVDSFWDGFPIIASHCAFKLYPGISLVSAVWE